MNRSLARFLSNLNQKKDQVLVRPGGEPVYCDVLDANSLAREHYPYALLSRAAYEEIDFVIPHDVFDRLERLGWKRCANFPTAALHASIAASHLRMQVWENERDAIVAVAFGGTVFKNIRDLASNLRWFLPIRNDAYTRVIREAAPAFADHFGLFSGGRKLVVTGHSLGGGLAQQFAYAIPIGRARVSQVYAFDPSPVTGYFSVPEDKRNANRVGLKIDRIFERGEVLSVLRSIISWFFRPSRNDPDITELRYMLFYRRSRAVVHGHSIAELEQALRDLCSANP